MTELRIAPEDQPTQAQTVTDPKGISEALAAVGVQYDRWPVHAGVSEPDAVLSAYAYQIDQLRQSGGYATADVVSLTPATPDHQIMRQKFLFEHTHSEDEVRFFVAGSGLFCLHIHGNVYGLTAEPGDLISVPAHTPHWFDMGPEPRFTCIRLFTDPQGWVAEATGSDIAKAFPPMGPVGV